MSKSQDTLPILPTFSSKGKNIEGLTMVERVATAKQKAKSIAAETSPTFRCPSKKLRPIQTDEEKKDLTDGNKPIKNDQDTQITRQKTARTPGITTLNEFMTMKKEIVEKKLLGSSDENELSRKTTLRKKSLTEQKLYHRPFTVKGKLEDRCKISSDLQQGGRVRSKSDVTGNDKTKVLPIESRKKSTILSVLLKDKEPLESSAVHQPTPRNYSKVASIEIHEPPNSKQEAKSVHSGNLVPIPVKKSKENIAKGIGAPPNQDEKEISPTAASSSENCDKSKEKKSNIYTNPEFDRCLSMKTVQINVPAKPDSTAQTDYATNTSEAGKRQVGSSTLSMKASFAENRSVVILMDSDSAGSLTLTVEQGSNAAHKIELDDKQENLLKAPKLNRMFSQNLQSLLNANKMESKLALTTANELHKSVADFRKLVKNPTKDIVEGLLKDESFKRHKNDVTALEKILSYRMEDFRKYPLNERMFFCQSMRVEKYKRLNLKNPGSVIGELRVNLPGSKRTACAATTTETILLCISKEEYMEVVNRGENNVLRENMLLSLRYMQLFDKNEDVLEKISSFFKIYTIGKNTIIQEEGKQTLDLSWIIEGNCKVNRAVSFINKVANGKQILSPSAPDQAKKDNITTLELCTQVLSVGEWFPSLPLISENPAELKYLGPTALKKDDYVDLYSKMRSVDDRLYSKYSVVADSTVIIASMPYSDFLQLVPREIIFEMVVNPTVTIYPIEEVQDQYLQQQMWSNHKKTILSIYMQTLKPKAQSASNRDVPTIKGISKEGDLEPTTPKSRVASNLPNLIDKTETSSPTGTPKTSKSKAQKSVQSFLEFKSTKEAAGEGGLLKIEGNNDQPASARSQKKNGSSKSSEATDNTSPNETRKLRSNKAGMRTKKVNITEKLETQLESVKKKDLNEQPDVVAAKKKKTISMENSIRKRWIIVYRLQQLALKLSKAYRSITTANYSQLTQLPIKDAGTLSYMLKIQIVEPSEAYIAQIESFLKEPAFRRSRETVASLEKVLSFRMPDFAKFSKNERMFFCQAMKLEKYTKGAILMKENNLATNFCFLLSGQIEFFKFDNGFKVRVNLKNPGNLIGDRGLQSKTVKRSVCAATTTDSKLLMITKDDYHEFINNGERELVKNKLETALSSVRIFSNHSAVLEKISGLFQIYNYPKGELIHHEGAQTFELSWVIDGTCQIVRSVPFHSKSANGKQILSIPNEKESVTELELVTQTLKTGDWFPDIPLLPDQLPNVKFLGPEKLNKDSYIQLYTKMPPNDEITYYKYSVKADSPVTIATIQLNDFCEIIPKDLLFKLIFTETITMYPTKELQTQYLQQQTWDNHKQNIVSQVLHK
ncbi:hypothetical protein HDV01_004246 [Terramyces sp. JEL0728]|nr:hypothetical protein HDV01_004246 [Terramyces sp. JEL0728]